MPTGEPLTLEIPKNIPGVHVNLTGVLGVHHVGLAAEIEAPNGLRFVTYKMRLEKGVNNSWTLR